MVGTRYSSIGNKICRCCDKSHSHVAIALHLEKSVKNVAAKTTLNLSAGVVVMINETIVILGKRKAKNAKDFTEINEEKSVSVDNLS